MAYINGHKILSVVEVIDYTDSIIDRTISSITSSVSSVGSHAFRNCANLTTAILTKATSIGLSAFTGCTSLTTMTLGANQVCTIPTTNSIPATSTQHLTIYVPSDLITSYQAYTNWSTLYNDGYIDFVAIS